VKGLLVLAVAVGVGYYVGTLRCRAGAVR